MKRVVFVDDDAAVLHALRRSLRAMTPAWEMHFCTRGQEALDLCAASAVDVVVSDLRMPGMDGHALLAAVMREHPTTARIMLTGHPDRGTRLRAMRVAHQYLAKPCDGPALQATIERVCAVQARLGAPALKELIGRLPSLPSLPTVYHALTRALQDDDISLREVGDIVAGDPAMSARVLQVANSAYFGLRNPLVHPREAVIYLGLETVRVLTLSVRIFEAYAPTAGVFDPTVFERHSLRTAARARALARTLTADAAMLDAAFCAGLLHEVGVLVLAANRTAAYAALLDRPPDPGQTLDALENEIFGASHAAIAAYLFGLWGLPEDVVETVLWHHTPDAAWPSVPLQALVGAEALAPADEPPPPWEAGTRGLDTLPAVIPADRIAAWKTICEGIA